MIIDFISRPFESLTASDALLFLVFTIVFPALCYLLIFLHHRRLQFETNIQLLNLAVFFFGIIAVSAFVTSFFVDQKISIYFRGTSLWGALENSVLFLPYFLLLIYSFFTANNKRIWKGFLLSVTIAVTAAYLFSSLFKIIIGVNPEYHSVRARNMFTKECKTFTSYDNLPFLYKKDITCN